MARVAEGWPRSTGTGFECSLPLCGEGTTAGLELVWLAGTLEFHLAGNLG